MAPRGRPRRQQRPPRLTRMDAAIDAMVPFGFSEDLVRTTVKDLLKEYGGDEGWAFIEGDAYKLLIDTILDEQEICAKEENLLENDSLQEGGAGDDPMAVDAGPSGGVLPLACSEVVDSLQEGGAGDDPMAVAAGPSGGVLPLICSEVVDSLQEGGAGDDPMAVAAGPSGGVLPRTCSEVVDSLQEGGAGDDPMAVAAGPSGGVLPLTCSEVVDTASETINTEINDHVMAVEGDEKGENIYLDQNRHQKERVNATGGVDNTKLHFSPPLLPSHHHLMAVEGDGKGENSSLDQKCHQKEIVTATGGVDSNSTSGNSGMPRDNTQMHSSPPLLPSPPPASSFPTQRRKPCHGWISSDEDDEPGSFIELTPWRAISFTSATTQRQSENVIRGTEKRAKRKTRWDVNPWDI